MKQRRSVALFFGGLAALVLAACQTTGPAAASPETGVSVPAEPEAYQPPDSPRTASSLTEALRQSCGELTSVIPEPVSIAVISIASAESNEGEFALEELTLLLVNLKRYRVVDRRNLDVIRAEQNFQLSGEVDDDTAVSIGHLAGAGIVITGTIAPYDSAKYLRLRALDVETGQIRAMSSWRFN